MPKDNKIVVDGVNIAARHRKPSQANPQGGIDRFPAPMHISKVKKVRVAVKSGETIND